MTKVKMNKHKVKKNDVELPEGDSKKRKYYKAIKNVEKFLFSDKKVTIEVADLEEVINDIALFYGANGYMPHDNMYAIWEREYLRTYATIVEDEGLDIEPIVKDTHGYHKVKRTFISSLEPSASGM